MIGNLETATDEVLHRRAIHPSQLLQIVRYVAVKPYWAIFLIDGFYHAVMCYILATDCDTYIYIISTGSTSYQVALSKYTKTHQPL
jgi:hypothetical protein